MCERQFLTSFRHFLCVRWEKNMFYFHPIRSKEPPIFNFPTLDSAKYFHKMAATAVKWAQILKTRIVVFLWSASRINWMGKLDCVNANIFHLTQKKIWNDNCTKTGSCELTLRSKNYPKSTEKLEKFDIDFLVYCYKAKCTVQCSEEHTRKGVCIFNSKLVSTTNTQIESIAS